jgi:hypothetical protein
MPFGRDNKGFQHSFTKIFEDDEVIGLRCKCGTFYSGMVAFRQRVEQKAYEHLAKQGKTVDVDGIGEGRILN